MTGKYQVNKYRKAQNMDPVIFVYKTNRSHEVIKLFTQTIVFILIISSNNITTAVN